MNILLAVVVLLLMQAAASKTAAADSTAASANAKCKIRGVVTDAATGETVPGVSVLLKGRHGGTMTDEEGAFVIKNLPPGNYGLQLSHVGYKVKLVSDLALSDGNDIDVTVRMDATVKSLKGITVTPGRFTIMGTEPAAVQTLTRGDIESMPQLGEDVYRAVTRLPGVSSSDFSARFTVRGGEHEEVLVTLDGLELYEPFHLKDIEGGVFSIIDVDAVESIDLMTGGYSAAYGNRMSGVYNITTKKPPVDQRRYSVGLSFLNARFLTEGTFANNRGSWLLSARRGYLDLVLGIMGEADNFRPTYYDVLSKVQYQLSGNHILSANFLYADDNTEIVDDEGIYAQDTIRTTYGNRYGWMTLRSQLYPWLFVRTLLSTGAVKHDRYGFDHSDWYYEETGDVLQRLATDKKSFSYLGFKQDWEVEVSDHYLLSLGYEAKQLNAEYDYVSANRLVFYDVPGDSIYFVTETNRQLTEPDGNTYAAYLSNRVRPLKPLTLELGVRYDQATYTDDELVSPRLSALVDLTERTALRAAWGRYYQSEGIHEMSVQDGEDVFYPATLAEHRVVALEHHFRSGLQGRLEAYCKKYSDLHPQYRNYLQGIEAFPELESDRMIVYRDGSIAKGIELFFKKDTGGKFTWWASYAYARVTDQISSYSYFNWALEEDDVVQPDHDVPGVNDQRHTIYLDMNYKPNNKWQWNLAWQYHSGWPYTEKVYSVDTRDGVVLGWFGPGELNGRNYEDFSRVDLRVNRYFNIGHGRVTAFLEIINLLNQKNVRCYEYDAVWSGGEWRTVRDPEYGFGLLPSIGIAWRMDM